MAKSRMVPPLASVAAPVHRKPPPGTLLLAFWRLSRPEAWLASVFPLLVGWVLATHVLVPGLAGWSAFWQHALAQGATLPEFMAALGAWWQTAHGLVLAMLAAGPLLWMATLLVNDAYDLEGDRLNARKQQSPLVLGTLSPRAALAGSLAAAAATLAVAAFVGLAFFGLMACCVALAWAYSAPPLRLKTRPGADVLVNALAMGFLCGAAGWSVAAPLGRFPFAFIPQGILVAAAVYIPTTLVDHDADLAAGYTTFATQFGVRRAFRIGFWCWVAANVGAVVLSYEGWLIPRAMLPLQLVFDPLMVYESWALIGRAASPSERVRGILVTSFTFLCVNAVFALMYTGLWRA